MEPLESVPGLPPPGATVPPPRTAAFDVRTPDASGTVLSVPEAARRWRVSRKTIMRRLAEGAVPGAYKRPGPKGEEWALPVAGLEVTFGQEARRAEPVEPVRFSAVDAEVTAVAGVPDAGQEIGQSIGQAMNVLVSVLDELRQELGHEREQFRAALQAGETERTQRTHLEQELRSALERAARAEALLPKRRRRRLGL